MSNFSAIVIGDESLLVQCSERMLEKGHAIRAVVTANPEIRTWAEGRGLRVEAQGRNLADRLGPITCDWLMSIANLKIRQIRIPHPKYKDQILKVQLVVSPTCPKCGGSCKAC